MVNRSPADARWPVTGTPLRDDMPVTGTLDLLLERAFCREASDIHIEPYSPAGYRLRLRVDGLMTAAQGCPVVLAEGLVARLKCWRGWISPNAASRRTGNSAPAAMGRHVRYGFPRCPRCTGKRRCFACCAARRNV